MDYESDRSRNLGCWHAVDSLGKLVTDDFSTANSSPNFTPGTDFNNFLIDVGFGKSCPAETRQFWQNESAKNYAGEEGRKRIRMAAINLRDRDGLHLRLGDVKCPVLWLHGTDDAVYSVANAKEEIEMFTGSAEKRLEIIQGGQHFLSASNPKEVYGFVREFTGKYGK
jgi:pimeloyl-ACP methyl ester carboxylesterase